MSGNGAQSRTLSRAGAKPPGAMTEAGQAPQWLEDVLKWAAGHRVTAERAQARLQVLGVARAVRARA